MASIRLLTLLGIAPQAQASRPSSANRPVSASKSPTAKVEASSKVSAAQATTSQSTWTAYTAVGVLYIGVPAVLSMHFWGGACSSVSAALMAPVLCPSQGRQQLCSDVSSECECTGKAQEFCLRCSLVQGQLLPGNAGFPVLASGLLLKNGLPTRRGGASNDWLPSSSHGHMDSVHLWGVGAPAGAALGLAWHRRSAVRGLCGDQQAVSATPLGQPPCPHVQHGLRTVVAGEPLIVRDGVDTKSSCCRACIIML